MSLRDGIEIEFRDALGRKHDVNLDKAVCMCKCTLSLARVWNDAEHDWPTNWHSWPSIARQLGDPVVPVCWLDGYARISHLLRTQDNLTGSCALLPYLMSIRTVFPSVSSMEQRALATSLEKHFINLHRALTTTMYYILSSIRSPSKLWCSGFVPKHSSKESAICRSPTCPSTVPSRQACGHDGYLVQSRAEVLPKELALLAHSWQRDNTMARPWLPTMLLS